MGASVSWPYEPGSWVTTGSVLYRVAGNTIADGVRYVLADWCDSAPSVGNVLWSIEAGRVVAVLERAA